MPSVIVDCAIYQDGRRTEGPEDFSDALEAARAEGHSFLWLGLHEPTEEEFERVSSEFGLHPLAVEDALKAHQRPKLEVYDDSLFMVLKPITYDDAAGSISASELMIFLGDSFVVTVRHGEASPLAAVRRRLEHEPDVLRHGPTAVLYAVGDAVVDHYIEVAAELQVDLEELEAEVFAPSRGGDSNNTAAAIYAFKREVLGFRRATNPLVEPMLRLQNPGCPSCTTRPAHSSGTSATTSPAPTSPSRAWTGCCRTSSAPIWRRWACARTTTCARSPPGRRWRPYRR